MKANIPWERYGLIAELSYRLENISSQFGKTLLQKMIYLLQEGLNVDCGYQFELYIYGPFAPQIYNDLDFLETSEGIEVHKVLSGTGGFSIHPGKNNGNLRTKAEDFLNDAEVKNKIDKLISDFGNYNAKELELRATIVYIQREFTISGNTISSKTISDTVSKIKPKFSKSEIDKAISELISKNYIVSKNEYCKHAI
ncbi:MAG: hypothetical protein V2I97_23980 [Desulfococcaceae bacterium]|jgi:uncharacterized protein YwgA|nr:hypothetical protein [Desulfococcaceae bacterium]